MEPRGADNEEPTTAQVRAIVCVADEKEMFRVTTFKPKELTTEGLRLQHGREVWDQVEQQTSKATRAKLYETVGGFKGRFEPLETIVSNVYVLPLVDEKPVHAALTESTSERRVFHLALRAKTARGKGKGAKKEMSVYEVRCPRAVWLRVVDP